MRAAKPAYNVSYMVQYIVYQTQGGWQSLTRGLLRYPQTLRAHDFREDVLHNGADNTHITCKQMHGGNNTQGCSRVGMKAQGL